MSLLSSYQQQQLTAAHSQVALARETTRNVKEDLHDLRRRVEYLALANQALFEILVERAGLAETDVLQKMHEIDHRDGTADRRMAGQPVNCPGCGRVSNTAKTECIYCGAPIGGHLFQKT